MNFQMFKLVLEKAEEPEIKLPASAGSSKKQETSRKKAFDCVDHNKLWKILQEMGMPDHLTCLLRNLHAGQETTEPDMEQQTGSKLRKEYIKAVYCHPAYLTYAEYIMPNARLEEVHDWIKIARRNINNLRFVDDITLMAESEEE